MAIRVQIQGRGQVAEFPDGTDPAIIDAAIKRDYFSDMGATIQGNPAASASETERMKQKFMQESGGTVERIKQNAKEWGKAAIPYVRPVVEGTLAGLGAVAGGIGAGPVGAVAGGALGYAGGKNIMDTVSGDWAKTPIYSAIRTLKDLKTGAMYEMGGQAAGPVLGGLASVTGKVVKPLLGKLSGVGQNAIEEAIISGSKSGESINPFKSTTEFDKALRGQTSGEEIVDNARAALNSLKEQRATAYQDKLSVIEQNIQPIDLRPLKMDVMDLMNKYNVKIVNGKIDTSRIAMGKTGRNDIAEIIDTISSWGTKQGDNTPLGLDTLKRQLDDFYSDSSQARQFVTTIRNKVKDTITTKVPEYAEMTKGYAEATKLIKDVESGLMMRKQGLSGRITADQTLRRLTSAMKDNFELRKDLVDILGTKGNEDLSGQIAGYTMNTAIPRGLAGTGPALAGQAAYAHFVNPSFWPVLAASSPRVQGEFLRMFGRGMAGAKKLAPMAASAARQTAITIDPLNQIQGATP